MKMIIKLIIMTLVLLTESYAAGNKNLWHNEMDDDRGMIARGRGTPSGIIVQCSKDNDQTLDVVVFPFTDKSIVSIDGKSYGLTWKVSKLHNYYTTSKDFVDHLKKGSVLKLTILFNDGSKLKDTLKLNGSSKAIKKVEKSCKSFARNRKPKKIKSNLQNRINTCKNIEQDVIRSTYYGHTESARMSRRLLSSYGCYKRLY
jgi:hypothetical protein